MALELSREHAAGLLGEAQQQELLWRSSPRAWLIYSSILSSCNSCLKWFWNYSFSEMGWLQFLAGLFLWVTLLFHVFTGFCVSLLTESHQKLYSCRRYHFHKENVFDLFLNLPYKTQCLKAAQCLPSSIPLEFGGGSRAHMQSTTLLDPWPTSRIWLLRQEHTATPAPALQCDTEPTSSHLWQKRKVKFLPLLSNLEVFSVPEILLHCLAVHSAQKRTPLSAKSDRNKQENVTERKGEDKG